MYGMEVVRARGGKEGDRCPSRKRSEGEDGWVGAEKGTSEWSAEDASVLYACWWCLGVVEEV